MSAAALIWVLVGATLCLTELVMPTAFIALVMGLSALVIAFCATWLPINLQVVLWMLLCAIAIGISRLVPRRSRVSAEWDNRYGETLTAIEAGGTGRVRYEGQSWAARCETDLDSIEVGTRVAIVCRRGTLLIVSSD